MCEVKHFYNIITEAKMCEVKHFYNIICLFLMVHWCTLRLYILQLLHSAHISANILDYCNAMVVWYYTNQLN